jgi:hypothetical protein
MQGSGDAMKSGSGTGLWPRVIVDSVDLLIGACAFFVAYATFNAAADLLDLLIAGVITLVGIGLMLEPITAGHSATSVLKSDHANTLAHG